MYETAAAGLVIAILTFFATSFGFFWMLIVWSHLREQTASLKRILARLDQMAGK